MDNMTLNDRLSKAVTALLSTQNADGHWCFELEADCTIPAEYILMNHFMGEINEPLEKKIANYLRRWQSPDGGWPLYYGGTTDISCTIKAYYALKMVGDSPNAPHMLRARRVVLERGGAARANVFTRILLAMFEQLPWRGVPFIPVEVMLLPKWFFFHYTKVSYWSRTVMIPLFILCTLRAKAKNPRKIDVQELFVRPPDEEKHYFPVKTRLGYVFLALDKIARTFEPLIPVGMRQCAMKKTLDWFIPRLNGLDGLGSIFPAMVNAYEALALTGHSADDPLRKTAREAIDKLVVERGHEAYCQPCVSPVWDTGLAILALQEVAKTSGKKLHTEAQSACGRALEWLTSRQITSGPADWREYRPDLAPGGWAFQYRNDYYPDLDDTAVVAYAYQRDSLDKHDTIIASAATWIAGLQSKNGGFAAFDADNTYYYLNQIPFADHGALLDPPTEDVSARCVLLFGQLVKKYPQFREPMEQCIRYLSDTQLPDGSFFGRWGTNYVYGTWSVLTGFESAGIPSSDTRVKRATEWLKSVQNADGGWGEDNDSYANAATRGRGYHSSAYQTAWALIALMAGGETRSPAVRRGVEWLLDHQGKDGLWHDPDHTAPGFPRVFYLKYHGYDKFFPVWALARFARETA